MANTPRTSGVFNLGALGGDGAASGDANWSDVTLLLDGDNNLTDRSGNTSMAWSGSASYSSSGKHSSALNIGSTGTFVQGPTGANTNSFQFGTDPFTIETWIYLNATPAGDDFIFCPRGSYLDTSSFVWFVSASGSNAQLKMYSYGSFWYTASSTFAPQTWTHVAVTRDTNKHFKFYINGQLIDTVTSQTSRVMGHTSTAPLRIGNGELGNQGLNGLLDDFRVTKGVARDIAADWTAGVYNSPLPQGAAVAAATRPTRRWGGMTGRSLVASTAASGDANWSGVELLLDFEGQSVTDHSGNATNLSVGNGSNTSGGTAVFGSGTNAKGSYSFNSSGTGTANPYIALTDPALGTGEFTMECWLKVSSASSYANLMTNEQQGTNPGYGFSWQLKGTSGGMLLWNQWALKITGTTNVVDGNWHHVALTRNSSNEVTLWVDGQKDHTNTVTDSGSYSITNSGTNPFLIGHNLFHANRHVAGYIDDVRITKGVCRYNDTANGFTPPSALPQGAAVAASDPSLANTGILSLSELLQVSYGLGPTSVTASEYLIVAGGGGGGAARGGGGGAGGYLVNTSAGALSGQYNVTVGAGGSGTADGTVQGGDGSDSSITGPQSFSATAVGGGGGGVKDGTSPDRAGRNGGSGGGPFGASATPGSGTTGQGYNGGAGSTTIGGGGGGAGEAGNWDGAGQGGDGVTHAVLNAISHGELSGGNYYVGGGGGGSRGDNTGTIPGGLGGGGTGATEDGDDGSAGTVNTGGGGGSGSKGFAGNDGGSGVVIIKTDAQATGTTGTVTETQVGSDWYYLFTGNGTVTFP